MSIRLKIFLGCLALTAVTVLLGSFTREAQKELGSIATRIYDDAFLAVSYLHSAQNSLTKAELAYYKDHATPIEQATPRIGNAETNLVATVPDILQDLIVAQDRAMSSEGRRAIQNLRTELEQLTAIAAEGGDLLTQIAKIDAALLTTVEIYAADGFRYRRSVGEMVEHSTRQTWMAIGLSVAVALVITVALSRSVVPPLRKALAIADAIAAGRLDNRIAVNGRDETSQLLRALSSMQASIAAAMARIQSLLDEQASSHAGELASQHARFEAALDNMTQGLCLFDADGRLAVANCRFVEMFGKPELGATYDKVFAGDELAGLLGTSDDRTAESRGEAKVSRDLPDGRSISIAHRQVVGGGWVATYEDVTESRRVEARLAHMARHDVLTGLGNRLLFREHMQLALARARRRGAHLAVLCLDLDRFKAVNDTLGHAVGDALLCAVAERLRACIRGTDLVVRLGGDEFAIVQDDALQPDDATSLARRIIDTLGAPFEIDRHQLVIGASVGIALAADGQASGEGHTSADALLKCADLALYRAKSDGRGTFRFFEAEMDARMQSRRMLELDLRQALAEEQFELFYQPLVDADCGTISGFEALLRWRHPERGLVPPASFVPLAEEIGLINALGAWVLRTACTDAALWPGNLKVAVNLSPVQFRGHTLASEVAQALSTSGLAANRLELEITESVLLQDDEAVLFILHELRALGTHISMDDFGTGYSSLSYLRRFPFDKIKIDQSFVRGLGEREDCAAIVRAVVGLGRSLGIAVNAEGVETQEQLTALRAEGCGEVQGYLFSQPIPAREIAALLRLSKQDYPPKQTSKLLPLTT